ncbi:MAG TPA: hypothetical protein VIH54_19835, partial [Chthoniobacterales bacterium]
RPRRNREWQPEEIGRECGSGSSSGAFAVIAAEGGCRSLVSATEANLLLLSDILSPRRSRSQYRLRPTNGKKVLQILRMNYADRTSPKNQVSVSENSGSVSENQGSYQGIASAMPKVVIFNRPFRGWRSL